MMFIFTNQSLIRGEGGGGGVKGLEGHSEAILKLIKKSTFSYLDILYIIGKVKVCALRICNCFWA